MRFAADFETTTDVNDCRVWAFGLFDIDSGVFDYGNNINDFFACFDNEPKTITLYFHNLKFDGEFIFSWLLNNGYVFQNSRFKLNLGSFSALISDSKVFYSISIRLFSGTLIHIYDSLKILPFSVEKISKGFNLPFDKLSIDYEKYRPADHELTREEIAYIKNDVRIVGTALKILFDAGLTSITAGSNALNDFKKIIGKKRFYKLFPETDDEYLRRSYKGGFTYLNPRFQNVVVGSGLVFDVNSLYPSVMYYDQMPYGEPIFYDGQYKHDAVYPLYIQAIRCNFKVKDNHIPTIQIKRSARFRDNEYLTESGDVEVVLTLTNVDMQLFFDHYDVYNLEYLHGYKFKASNKIFRQYIDKWNAEKVKAAKEKNDAMYILSKLMLNSLYGKFGTNPNSGSCYPALDSDGIVRYKLLPKDDRDPVYVAVASFITSYAREKTIRSAQKNYDRFMYADTDSLHLLGDDMPDNLDIHDTDLGKWQHELTFIKAKYLRQKCYLETYVKDGQEKTKVTIAGMPKSIHYAVNYDNFNYDTTFKIADPDEKPMKNTVLLKPKTAKLRPKHVNGGIVLVDTHFTIKGVM